MPLITITSSPGTDHTSRAGRSCGSPMTGNNTTAGRAARSGLRQPPGVRHRAALTRDGTGGPEPASLEDGDPAFRATTLPGSLLPYAVFTALIMAGSAAFPGQYLPFRRRRHGPGSREPALLRRRGPRDRAGIRPVRPRHPLLRAAPCHRHPLLRIMPLLLPPRCSGARLWVYRRRSSAPPSLLIPGSAGAKEPAWYFNVAHERRHRVGLHARRRVPGGEQVGAACSIRLDEARDWRTGRLKKVSGRSVWHIVGYPAAGSAGCCRRLR